MKNCELKDPEFYLESLRKTIEAHKRYHGGLCSYTKGWRLQLERKVNAHRDCNGRSWGWWEIWPIRKEVGFWEDGRDDLECVDVVEWNRKAKELAP